MYLGIEFFKRNSVVSARISFPKNCRHNTVQSVACVFFDLVKACLDESLVAPKNLRVDIKLTITCPCTRHELAATQGAHLATIEQAVIGNVKCEQEKRAGRRAAGNNMHTQFTVGRRTDLHSQKRRPKTT